MAVTIEKDKDVATAVEQQETFDIVETKNEIVSTASIAKSNKQGWGLACIRRGQAPSDKLRSSYLVMSK